MTLSNTPDTAVGTAVGTPVGTAAAQAPPRVTIGRGTSEFSELAQRIRTSGLMRRRYGYYWAKLVAVPVAFAAAVAVFVWIGNTWWQHKHTRHHASPNQIGADPDIDLPVLSLTPDQAVRPRSRSVRWLLAHQGLFIAEYCRSRGIPYVAAGLGESYGIVLRYINRAGLGERDPFVCPMVAQRQSI